MLSSLSVVLCDFMLASDFPALPSKSCLINNLTNWFLLNKSDLIAATKFAFGRRKCWINITVNNLIKLVAGVLCQS